LTEREAALAMLMAEGVGPVTAAGLRGRFGSYAAAVEAVVDGRDPCGRAAAGAIRRCVRARAWEAEFEAARRANARFAVAGEADYPEALRHTATAPVGVFVAGRCPGAMPPMIAVVGTRTPTPRGSVTAGRLAADLGEAGLTVVSGLARGIDTAAHEGALEVGAPTVAVLGCGIARVYPPENAGLAIDIRRDGAIISEFPPAAGPRPGFFPRRIIAGVAAGVVVVEAAERSGALITARMALEEGREVFAVPGPIDEPLSVGPNRLIKAGARLVEDARDVIDEIETSWGPLASRGSGPETVPGRREGVGSGARDVGVRDAGSGGGRAGSEQGDEARVAAELSLTPATADELSVRTGLTVPEVLAALMTLELSGRARRVPGGRFVTARCG
jgi:DNA processing protein